MKKKLLVFTNSDAHFYAHLLPIAKEAIRRGYEVVLLTDFKDHEQVVKSEGIQVRQVEIARASLNPFSNLRTLLQARRIISEEAPDVIHNFTIKPILFGSILKLLGLKARMVNSFLGMGTLFISNALKYKIVRNLTIGILSKASKDPSVQFNVQNKDDKELLERIGAVKVGGVISKCSVGVPTEYFPELSEPEGRVVFALVGRMLIDKGVREFIEAARILKKEGLRAEFWLVGEPDQGNVTSLSMAEIMGSHDEGIIVYKGYMGDIHALWREAHVSVLPSYREGLSRSLLEAGAHGRAIITTDAPGGRELVQDKVNGLLVPVKESQPLAEAMRLLAEDTKMRIKLAKQVRQDILQNYDADYLARAMVDLY